MTRATYTNKALNETHTIVGETMDIEKAWNLAEFVCNRKGWNIAAFTMDVTITVEKL